jgi:cell division protein FtsL
MEEKNKIEVHKALVIGALAIIIVLVYLSVSWYVEVQETRELNIEINNTNTTIEEQIYFPENVTFVENDVNLSNISINETIN